MALLAGAALALAFPEPGLSPLAWVTPAVLLVLSDGVGWKRGFGLGFAFGLGFFGVLIHWFSIIGFVAYFLSIMIEASFIAAFAGAWGLISRNSKSMIVAILGPPVLWVALAEFLRANFPFRGFTWGQLAQSQVNVPHLLRVTGLGGSWLLAALLITVNALIARALLSDGTRLRRAAPLGAAALLLLLPLALSTPRADGDKLRVAIVQGNIPRDAPDGFAKQLTILNNHATLTESLSDVDLVVWPESSVGIDHERDLSVATIISEAARATGAPMIVGGNLSVPPDHYKVMAFLVSDTGEFVDRYQKTHLVPFGEYVPGRKLIDWLPPLDQVPTDAIAGDDPVVFEVGGGKVAPVISFEGDFGSLVRGRIDEGGRLLVVATNTSTWESSWASAQHVAMSQVRAAENGVNVVHAALTGISAFVDPAGRVLARTPLWTSQVLVREIAFATSVTPYARVGDWVAYLCLLATLGLVGASWHRHRSDTVPR